MLTGILNAFLRLVFGVLGVVWVAMGLYAGRESADFKLHGRRAPGVISKVVDTSDDDHTSHTPYVRYTIAGKSYEAPGNRTAFKTFDAGEKVAVLYRPGTTAPVRIDTLNQLWGDSFYYVLGGLVSVAFSLGGVWSWLTRRRSTPG